MMTRAWTSSGLGIALFLASQFRSDAAMAHSRWFLGAEPLPPPPPVVFDAIYGILIAIAILVLIGGLALEELARRKAEIARYLYRPIRLRHDLDWRLLSVAFGSTLILNSMSQVLVAPDLPLGNGVLHATIAFLQIVTGAMFVLQSRLLLAAIATLLLPVSCWALHSFGHAIDYAFELVAIGGALFLMAPLISTVDRDALLLSLRSLPSSRVMRVGTTSGPFQIRWQIDETGNHPAGWRDIRSRSAADFLRIGLGIQLIALAAHDKLLFPAPSLAFVDKFSFVNIPAFLGATGFTNLHFVVGAGLVEATLGAMLVGNVAARAVSCLLLSIFSLTAVVFGMHELIGHLPLMASFVVLIAAGSTERPATRELLFPSVELRSAILAVVALAVGGFALNAPGHAPQSLVLDAASVPRALFARFIKSQPGDFGSTRELQRAAAAVRTALDAARAGQEVDKDDLARRLFELTIRYESAHGQAGAGLWLRYAHLTAACSHDDLLAFRSLVGANAWSESLQRAPAPLVEELLPLARRSASAILRQDIAESDGTFWSKVAWAAPNSGPNYVHTHTLASIARIIDSAGADAALWQSNPHRQVVR